MFLQTCGAYREIVWLDLDKVRDYFILYRAHGYTVPGVTTWEEDRSRNPYPYNDEPPAWLWRLIEGDHQIGVMADVS